MYLCLPSLPPLDYATVGITVGPAACKDCIVRAAPQLDSARDNDSLREVELEGSGRAGWPRVLPHALATTKQASKSASN